MGGFIAVHAAAGVLEYKVSQWNQNPSSVPAFAEALQSLGDLIKVTGEVSVEPEIVFAGKLLNAYGVLLQRAADYGGTLDIYGWIESITQEAARTESLAYVKYLAQWIDPAISTDTFLSHIDSSANDETGLIEARAFLFSLKTLLGVGSPASPNTPAEVYTDTMSMLQAIKTTYGENALQFRVSAVSVNEAKGDFGVFLSLVHLTPFALKPLNHAAELALQDANSAVIYRWQLDRLQTPEQIADGDVYYSDKWIADRIDMVAWQNQINILDAQTSADNPATSGLANGRHFYDFKTSNGFYTGPQNENTQQIFFGDNTDNGAIAGLAGDDHLYGGAGNDVLVGNNGNDYLEGNEDNDTIDGGIGNDTLLGGDGNDELKGGKGNDELKGGRGTDSYIYTSGDGFDAKAAVKSCYGYV